MARRGRRGLIVASVSKTTLQTKKHYVFLYVYIHRTKRLHLCRPNFIKRDEEPL